MADERIMQLQIRNKIIMDNEVEWVDESYPVTVTPKNQYLYLTYVNEEDEKVIIKCNQEELVMTRFSTPKSIMRFHAQNPAVVFIPTPLGIQHFKTETSHYVFDPDKKSVTLHYCLKALEGESALADYELELRWQ